MKPFTSLCQALLAYGIAAAASAALAAPAPAASSPPRPPPPALYVYSTIDALLAGAYDGELTVQTLRTKGDFGLGTFNHLDGEMLVLKGVVYHFRADGSVTVADPAERVPLAYVVPFKPGMAFEVGAGELGEIEASIDKRLANKNLFYAVQVDGTFADITTRAIAAQTRPYKPLAELVKTQSVFKRENVTGTLVGLRSPAFGKGISPPGWHWHFVSQDRAYGGHVLGGRLALGAVQAAAIEEFDVTLPANDDFAASDQRKDRSEELRKVEGAREARPAKAD